MSFLFNWFRGKPAAPERVPTDTVIPLGSFDDTKVNRSLSLDFTMRYDDVLDVQKLVGALEKLLDMPGWRKLGARLRLNDQEKLEYHVPEKFTKERPSVSFTHITHEISISSHPLASQIPRATNKLTSSPPLGQFRPILLPPNSATKLEDWIYSDRPQFQLHIVSFEDATLVTLSWLHKLLDAMGRSVLLKAWTAVLEGREHDVPELYGYDFDPLASLGAPPSKIESEEEVEESVIADRQLKGWSMFKFVISYVWELLIHRREEQRMICIPAAYFKRLKEQCLQDLKGMHPATITMDTSDPSNPKPFLSDGDTISILNVFGMRNLLSSTSPVLLPKGKAYIANAPLGLIASEIRRSLVEQGTRSQVNAICRLQKRSLAKTGIVPVFGTSDMTFGAFSNWSKGKMFETDFSAAVVKEGEVKHIAGRPTYIQADGNAIGFSVRNSAPALGRDNEGNYWVEGMLRCETWENIERAIEGME
ncbi:hypothetical protein K469DRAFT_743569 [Zopfia rhizophila CBS 207.26]|uniref:LysR family regulatory protein n=1 Tax=Zopfia rhizophila CBS 207.26 TaxID=1314779 RepID=A0A6A6D5Z1_9PEZI|nr:hypothetical protein K469DRAFT_743569 [Zopfia rhizophila CBS 207.26]